MKITEAELEIVCGITSKLPKHTETEIAFLGKSNVGKSSLINAIINRKALARTSQRPGKTRTINYYKINKKFYFVDLPGYGYASVSKDEKAKWAEMIENYLHTSKSLKAVFMLVDIRREPSKDDMLMYEWITHYELLPIIVATKSDKINKSQVKKNCEVIRTILKCPEQINIIPFSNMSGEGKDALLGCIGKLV